jgi:hypothetical protein
VQFANHVLIDLSSFRDEQFVRCSIPQNDYTRLSYTYLDQAADFSGPVCFPSYRFLAALNQSTVQTETNTSYASNPVLSPSLLSSGVDSLSLPSSTLDPAGIASLYECGTMNSAPTALDNSPRLRFIFPSDFAEKKRVVVLDGYVDFSDPN